MARPARALALALALTFALGSRSPARDAPAGPPAAGERPTVAQLTGTWEGQVLHADGHRARAKVVLAPGPMGVEGSYALQVLDEEGPGKPIRGDVRSPSGVDATLLLTGGERVSWTGRVGPAGTHAEAAFFGSFTGPKRQGVFMLYRYR